MEKKLLQIASRLEHMALKLQTQGETEQGENKDTKQSPLKVKVAKPFKDDLQGYFVLTLEYLNNASILNKETVLSQAGVKGSILKAQVWSNSTFQLQIPKYESDETHRSNKRHNDNTAYRSKEVLLLICMKLAFAMMLLQALGIFIKKGGNAFGDDNLESMDNTGVEGDDRDINDGLAVRIGVTMTWAAAILRKIVRRVAFSMWTISLSL